MTQYVPPKTPWTVIELDETQAQIYGIGWKACDGQAIPIPDAERIVACVNLLAQVSTELLERAATDLFAMDEILKVLIEKSSLVLIDPQGE